MTNSTGLSRSLSATLVASALTILTACGPTVSDDAKKSLSKDVNCSTASQDIATLEKERASTLKRVSTGVQYVVPIAAAVNIFRSYNQDGTSEEFYNDREQVLTGDYNKAVDAKVAEIKKVCSI